jgi:hypothetical protein
MELKLSLDLVWKSRLCLAKNHLNLYPNLDRIDILHKLRASLFDF